MLITLPVLFITQGPDDKYCIRGSDARLETKLSIRNGYDVPEHLVDDTLPEFHSVA